MFGSTGGGVVNTGDNSLASDFSREGLGNIDTDEVDPIAEAEVYLAYGRDAQAEEILKDALKKDPQRQEIYLKLLEIHAQHNKPSAFETVASELYAVCNGQGETWHKAVALGRQLDPNNPMFAEGGVRRAAAMCIRSRWPKARHRRAKTADRRRPGIPDGRGNLDLADVGRHAQDACRHPRRRGKRTREDRQAHGRHDCRRRRRGRRRDGAARWLRASPPRRRARQALPKRSRPRGKVSATARNSTSISSSTTPTSLRRWASTAPSRNWSAAASEGPSSGMAPQLTRPAAALELDKLDLSFDPDRSTFEDPTPSVLDGQWHDAATKLDLAKAYQEMGDVEGAREILQEVLHEGDDQQKTEAKTLLAKLA